MTGCRTVDSLLAECPDFWCSRQLWRVLQQGSLVEADPAFFASQLVAVLQSARHSSGNSSGSSSKGRREPEDAAEQRHGAARHSSGNGSRSSKRRRESGEAVEREHHAARDSTGSSSSKGRRESEEATERRHRAARGLRAAVDDFVVGCPTAVLCRRLLHLLPPGDIVAAAIALIDHLPCHTDRQLAPAAASMSASCHDTPATPRSASRRDPAAASGRAGAASSVAQLPTAATSRSASRQDTASASCRDGAASSVAQSPAAARQLALRALIGSCREKGLTSLLVSHSAVLHSDHMLRWLQEDEEGAQVGAAVIPLFLSGL